MKRLFLVGLILLFTCLYAYADTEVVGIGGAGIEGGGTFDIDAGLVLDSTLDEATGDEAALTLNYTTDKLTSGNDTCLEINMTDTASPGTSYLINAKAGGVSRFSVTEWGHIEFPYLTASGFIATNLDLAPSISK